MFLQENIVARPAVPAFRPMSTGNRQLLNFRNDRNGERQAGRSGIPVGDLSGIIGSELA